MSFKTFLESRSIDILNHWIRTFWESFGESAPFFRKEIDQFTNPFGYYIEEAFREILQALIVDFSWERVDPYLEKLAQIRSVQETLPSQAAKFFLDLKKIIRERFGDQIIEEFGFGSLLEWEDKINCLLIRFMDFYQKYRERLYEVRLEEFKKNNYLLLKRAGLIWDGEDEKFIDNKKH